MKKKFTAAFLALLLFLSSCGGSSTTSTHTQSTSAGQTASGTDAYSSASSASVSVPVSSETVPEIKVFAPGQMEICRYVRDDGAFTFEFALMTQTEAVFRFFSNAEDAVIDFAVVRGADVCPDGEKLVLTFDGGRVVCDEKTAEADTDGDTGGSYTAEKITPPESYPIPAVPEYTADPYSEADIDAILAAAARESLGLDEKTPLDEELLRQVLSIDVFERGLVSLTGIEYMTELESFSAYGTYLRDITPLTALEKLREITVGNSYVEFIPDLSGMKELTVLQLTNCLISDLTPVASAPSLKYLNLSDNRITSAAPLLDTHGLESLGLSGNCMTDIGLLAGVEDLESALLYTDFDIELAAEAVSRAKEIVSEIITEDMTQIEKEYRLYRYVIDNTDYEIVPGLMKPFGYTALILGKGVCGHYSEAFTLLCTCAGLDAICVSSNTHAWNMVRIGDGWYHVDTLWDEGCGEFPGFFNRGAEFIINTPEHGFDLLRYPQSYEMSRLLYQRMFYGE